ncbi:hypothetical protein [Mucilaginibacter myungsuensis]|uniref:Glycoside hydrolase family 42 N-terminal domain-containing protein n=1 Tax=Mucilaginibacter myungsuensis TaxID=649104 RepID=A0A929KZA9_9SPHI|nr:hypothetical protein [Mucilaginibacter myungsuensis]MBE9664466.1 hypothetical protein [Mucilaginibacter myungsuensis]MDN3601389.1 hypothetical protein [Mucilaginibacter myungsuensis]
MMRKNVCIAILLILSVAANAQVPDQTWWTFQFPKYRSSDTSLLDLRYLNERVAGEHGFIKMSKDGNSLTDGQGKPMRFWATNGGSLARDLKDAQLDSLARFLAKMGVNMVRYHGSINPKGKTSKLTDVDTAEARNIWRCVAAMKKQGIYTVISPFWPHNGHMGEWVPKEWGINGYSGKDDMWGVLFFDPQLQKGYKAWVKYLYTTSNPYTKVPLKDEPAVGMVQIENEDSPFFWTMSNVKPEVKKLVGSQFSKWLKAKYPAAKDIKDTMDLIPIWDMTQAPRLNDKSRLHDQVEFYAQTLRKFYDDMARFYRNELGCKQLINGNNWRTASQSRLLDLERWANAGVDVIATNKYFDPGHRGSNSGWRIDPGDFYTSPSALKNPADLPTNVKHVDGRPMMITESGWNLPNRYQTEGPLLVAAYGGLTGLDAYFWFTPTAMDYMRQPHLSFLHLPDGQHPMNRWTSSTPGELGMFPANALIQRLGYVKEVKILQEHRTMKSMLDRTIPPIFEEQAFDPNRDFVTSKNADQGQFGPMTFLTGGVSSSYEAKADEVAVGNDLTQLIDTKAGKVTSATGQLQLDHRKGIFTLNTPKAKAVSGFLNTQKKFDLGTVTITSQNEYATIELVSMDGQDIDRSAKILLQIGTIFRPTGWQEEPATIADDKQQLKGYKITNTGKMPWLGMPALGTITIKNKQIRKAIQLDAAGYAVKELKLISSADGIGLELPKDAMYILLER